MSCQILIKHEILRYIFSKISSYYKNNIKRINYKLEMMPIYIIFVGRRIKTWAEHHVSIPLSLKKKIKHLMFSKKSEVN